MDDMSLPPELERFADEAVAAGRYRDRAELLAASVGLLRRAEAERAAFIKTLEDAEAEADRDGWLSLDEVLQDMDRIIEAQERRRA